MNKNNISKVGTLTITVPGLMTYTTKSGAVKKISSINLITQEQDKIEQKKLDDDNNNETQNKLKEKRKLQIDFIKKFGSYGSTFVEKLKSKDQTYIDEIYDQVVDEIIHKSKEFVKFNKYRYK